MNILSPIYQWKPRGEDPTGFGFYGAKRGTRKHKGFDILAEPGTPVCSPISGFIVKYGYPYTKSKKLRYIDVQNDVYRFRLMYAELESGIIVNTRVFIGQKIGKVQDIAGYWKSGMLNHLHVECYKHGLLTDPEPLFEL